MPKRESSPSTPQRRRGTVADINTLANMRPALRIKHTGEFPDLNAMRSWKGKRKITRTVLLLVLLERVLSHDEFTRWIERPNQLLGSDAPIDLLNRRQWRMMGDFLDDFLTGALA